MGTYEPGIFDQISIKGNFLQNLTEFIKDGPSEGDLSISSHK